MPTTREDFDNAVRKMQDEGVALTMANLMVRTELPRAQIEAWLDAGQRDVHVPRRATATKTRTEDEASTAENGRGGIASRAKSLRGEIVGDVMRSKLGLGDAKSDGEQRGVKTGGVLGLVLPPAGLLYAAPYPIAALGTVAYVALAWLALHIPFVGIPYLLIPMHLAGGALGAAYAWRHNRAGRRSQLLPKGRRERRDR